MKLELTPIGRIHSPHREATGTPLLDLKPYLPDCDAYAVNRIGWCAQARDAVRADDRFTDDSKLVY